MSIILKTKEREMLMEALRRWLRFHHGTPLTERWLGLAYKTDARQAVEAGFMVWIDGEEPPNRSPGWLKLTDKGAQIVQTWINQGFTNLQEHSDWEYPVDGSGMTPNYKVNF